MIDENANDVLSDRLGQDVQGSHLEDTGPRCASGRENRREVEVVREDRVPAPGPTTAERLRAPEIL
jgi:hypothetical protein